MAEHRCRIRPPNYPEYARVNCDQEHNGKCIDVVYGIKGTGRNRKSEIQALRYPSATWSVGDARAHCKSRKGKFDPGAKEKDMKDEEKTTPEPAATRRGRDSAVSGQYEEVPTLEELGLPDRLKPRHLQDENAELEELLETPLKKP
jgi:hypothetical protein